MASESLSRQAISAYRNLLRAQRATFRGDFPILQAARDQARLEYDKNKYVTDETKVQELIKKANDVATVIRKIVVQGVKAEDKNAYQLRITKDSALGDNTTIRLARQKQVEQFNKGQRCCS